MTIHIQHSDIHSGHLVLINRNYPLKLPISDRQLSPLRFKQASHVQQQALLQLETTCMSQLMLLLEAIQAEDQIALVSGYRTAEEQSKIYADSLRQHGAAFTASYVARPNESEHQSGLAIDLGVYREQVDLLCPDFPDYGVSLAFKRRAAAYGFIQRYQHSKTELTGIAEEPWHFRYVGYPHSVIMERDGLCLEEYITWIRSSSAANPYLYLDEHGRGYHIFYIAANEDPNSTTAIPVEENLCYWLSGNNIDGFIITTCNQ